MNTIFLESCITTMVQRKIEYDYLFCVPPDYDELQLSPDKNSEQYYKFLYTIFELFAPRNNIVTVAITDRKFNAGITAKHVTIITIMQQLGYKYISQKIWCKSHKINLYRLNYSFVMSFAKKPYKQNHYKSFEEDVWECENQHYQGYKYAIAIEVVERCILNFSDENDIIYDPFSGSATTALASLKTKRNYVGSEINAEFHVIGNNRIAHYVTNGQKENEQITFYDEEKCTC